MRRAPILTGMLFLFALQATPVWAATDPTPPAISAPADSLYENRPFLRSDKPAPIETTDPIAQSHSPTFDPTRVMLALVGVLGLIFLLRIAIKRVFPGAAVHRGSRAIKVLSRSTISPRQHLLLIQVGKRLLVVGDSGSQLNQLCEISDESETAALLAQLQEDTMAAAWRFESLFGRARKGFESTPTEETAEPETPSAPPSSADSFDSTHELNDPSLAATQKELDGLSDKVRDLARQLGDAR